MTDEELVAEVEAFEPLHKDMLEYGWIMMKWGDIDRKLNTSPGVCLTNWRNLMFQYIDNFHCGSQYKYYDKLQFTSITQLLKENSRTEDIGATLMNLDHPEPRPYGQHEGTKCLCTYCFEYNTSKHVKSCVTMKNNTKQPVIIHNVTHVDSVKWFPFLLLPGKRRDLTNIKSSKTTISWSKFGSPIPPISTPVEVRTVNHDKDTVVFFEIERAAPSLCIQHDGCQCCRAQLLNEPHVKALTECLPDLCLNMDNLEVVNFLVSRYKICVPKRQLIESKQTPYLQNQELVTWLQTQPRNTFEAFCEALELYTQNHLVINLRAKLGP